MVWLALEAWAVFVVVKALSMSHHIAYALTPY